MHKALKRVLLGLLVAVLAVLGLVSWALYPKISNLKSEYTTAGVIGDLDAYVAAHPGDWPKAWKELGNGSDRSRYTRFRFDLTAERILAQPELIYDAAKPVTGHYLTYPHAREQLAEVMRKLQENAGKAKPNISMEPSARSVALLCSHSIALDALLVLAHAQR